MAVISLVDELIVCFDVNKDGKSAGDNDKEIAVAFTARLMALYRSQEYKLKNPLLQDPFAEYLVGDMTQYLSEHPFQGNKLDYPIIRSYYIEETLLKRFKNNKNGKIQIVSFGAGLDTKPYRLEYLTENDIFFEIDVDIIHKYKSKILDKELNAKPLCYLKSITMNLELDNSYVDTMQLLISNGFEKNIATFWLFEGVVMYINIDSVKSLLNGISNYSLIGKNEIFVDVSNSYGNIKTKYGTFLKHFEWGLTLSDAPLFFAQNGGWDVIDCNYCGHYDKGRNVAYETCIFFNGTKMDKNIINSKIKMYESERKLKMESLSSINT